MRILLDENLPRRLAKLSGPGVQATTVGRRGWSGKKNGELLGMAEKEFDAFLTTDKGIPHQQNPTHLDLTIVLLRAKSNNYEDLSPLMDDVNSAPASAEPGSFVRIPRIGSPIGNPRLPEKAPENTPKPCQIITLAR